MTNKIMMNMMNEIELKSELKMMNENKLKSGMKMTTEIEKMLERDIV